MSWEEAKADALEVQADTLDAAILSLTRISGMYAESSNRRHEVRDFTDRLQLDADNLREEAKTWREKAPATAT